MIKEIEVSNESDYILFILRFVPLLCSGYDRKYLLRGGVVHFR